MERGAVFGSACTQVRALIDSRPIRIRIPTDRPRGWSALAAGRPIGVRLEGADGDGALVLEHERREGARPRARAGGARPGRAAARSAHA